MDSELLYVLAVRDVQPQRSGRGAYAPAEAVAEREPEIAQLVDRVAGIDERRVLLAIDHTGNTSSASVPTALDEAVRAGRIRDGDRVLLFALGGGMAWASTLLTWTGPRTIAAARAKAR